MIRLYCLALLVALLASTLTPAAAYPLERYGFAGSLDTTLSYAAMMRAQKQDAGLIGLANGGSSRSVNDDDGNLNYDQGELVSSLIKLGEELQLSRDNWNFFARADYFYDQRAAAKREQFGSRGQDRLVSRARLLDVYWQAELPIGTMHPHLRIGSQVIDWGEASFIGNGINVVNPVDVNRLRQPGGELKDALLPTPAILLSMAFRQGTSLSAFALARADQTQLDPRSAYFSTTDVASDDGNRVIVGYGRRVDQHRDPTSPAEASVYLSRDKDRRSDGWGQYGLSLRQLTGMWGSAEFGLYYLHYHSRLPFYSVIKQLPGTPGSGSSAGNGSAHYYLDYPRGIDLYGASLNASLPLGLALQGEYSLRPKLPVQLPGPDLSLSALGFPSQIAASPALLPPQAVVHGYRRIQAQQLQFTLSRLFASPGLGANQLLVLGEWGGNHLDLTPGLKFAGPGVYLPTRPEDAIYANGSYQHTGFATAFSWGYRLTTELRYSNLLGALSMTPRLAYSSDVKGVGPNFNQGSQAATVELTFDYLLRWRARLGYTSFFGGRRYGGEDLGAPPGQSLHYSSSANPLRDRDFAAISLDYSF